MQKLICDSCTFGPCRIAWRHENYTRVPCLFSGRRETCNWRVEEPSVEHSLSEKVKENEQGEESVKIAYVFDHIKDREALAQFNKFLVDNFEEQEYTALSDTEPRVFYTFKVFRDREELRHFQKNPNYLQALGAFEQWLHAKHKWPGDDMSEEAFQMLEQIWEKWGEVLEETDAFFLE